MNVYDFDGTVYDGDSSIDFYLFCIKKKPSVFVKSICTQITGAILYVIKHISKESFKEKYFTFLKHIQTDDVLLNEFWEIKSKKIKQWYLNQRRDSDIIISASPEFLLKPICNVLNVSLIASKVDIQTGKYTGRNCHGKEKVHRLFKEYPDVKISEFYTDSHSDLPLAEIAEKSFLVKKNYIFKFDNEFN